MAKSVTVKVEGLRELGERMKSLSEDVNNRIARAATAAGAVVIRNAAQAKVPVDTGNLKKNIIVKRLPKGESAGLTSEHIVTVRKGKLTKKQKSTGLKDAYYGQFIEFGTVKAPARPFLRPAFDQNKEKAVDAIKSRIDARLKKAGA
ncbi:HK97 gp10 family phage protein [Variovorax boronicumulans]|uniref:HK97-gp10 family putative phage morphogenesis protein n=1 Tax=Variovorax boronicumulans TaxID=436515 RepID=UPI0027826A18|nr:HK97-gp10 family putative phage morphogenesis protein [Variovorax boronicumulans]MDP9991967.1 HK97 gp10 family phage protein [Variovorax boronicumulans]MDQ0001862.1 HK97 gp10 family phage protein [Variovorax boronicumulans]